MYHKQHIHLDLKGKLTSFLSRFIVGHFFFSLKKTFFPNFGSRLLKKSEKEPTPIHLFKTTLTEHKIQCRFNSYGDTRSSLTPNLLL